jgi:hypothetical protein
MQHVWGRGRGEVYIEFSGKNLRERGHLEDAGVDKKIILKWIFKKWDGGHGFD